MPETKSVPWKRKSAEGMPIVLSILLAFSIEADALRTQKYWNLLYTCKESYSDQVRQLVVAKDYCDKILVSLRAGIERLAD